MKKKFFSVLSSVVLITSLLPLSSNVHAQTTPENKGKLVIAGGGLSSTNTAVYNKFIELAGGKGAKIGIIPAASSSLKSSNAFKNDLTAKYGIPSSNVEILKIAVKNDKDTAEDESKWAAENANTEEMTNKIKGLDAIWFVGGDQIRIIKALRNTDGSNTKALDAIWEMYRAGHVLGGTSAGAAIMSDVMISGGDSLGALKEGYTYEDLGEPNEYNPTFIAKGLGFFEHGIVDQHFDERARLGRLINTAYALGDKNEFAYGVDEDTAMVFDNNTDTVEVIGNSGVAIIDISKANATNPSPKTAPLKNGIQNIDVSYLSTGDTLNITTKKFTFPKGKYDTKGYEYLNFKALPATGVFTPYGQFKNYLSYSLTDNKANSSVTSYLYDSSGSGYELTFRKETETNGYWYNPTGQDDYSILHVKMDITPKSITHSTNNTIINGFKKSTFTQPIQNPMLKDNKGNLIIVGGALSNQNKDVYKKFIELAKGPIKAKVGIIPAASGNLKSSKAFRDALIANGLKSAQVDILPIATKDYSDKEINVVEGSHWANNDTLAKNIEKYTAIWFVGGDQTLITKSLRNTNGTDTKVLKSIWKMYWNGGLIGGTSAGAAIMSDTMLAGGDSYSALLKGFTSTYDGLTSQELSPVYLERGLGFFGYGIIDQHFDNKARLGRLITTAAYHEKNNYFSYGIDEDTAMVFSNKTKDAEFIGTGGVTLVDLSKAKYKTLPLGNYQNILLSYVRPGDKVNAVSKEINIISNKLTTRGYEYGDYTVAPNTGVLTSHGSLTNFISYSLVDNYGAESIKSYSFNGDKGFELTFRKNKVTEGYWNNPTGRDDYSFTNVSLDIKPVRTTVK